MADTAGSQNQNFENIAREKENDCWQSYHSMVTKISHEVSALEEVCGELGMREYKTKLKKLQERMLSRVFSVGIIGEFKRGKSTLVSALLGAEMVPSDVVPTTAAINYVRWDASTRAEVYFKDGTKKEIPVEDLASYVTMTTKENADMAETVECAQVYYPCRFCRNGVQMIDTPGLNNDVRMSAIAEQIIPSLDVIVMVLTAEIPLSASEAAFIQDKLMLSDLERVIFVSNKMDYIRKKDRQRFLSIFKWKIQESVLEKIVIVYGEDSEEYKSAKKKMEDLRVYGISARDALDGRLEGDEVLVNMSGILEFEEALSKMLTWERGMPELAVLVNTIDGIAGQARVVIDARRDSLTMDQQELEAICAEGTQAAAQARDRVRAQKAELKGCASGLYLEMLLDVHNAYQSTEQELLAYVDALVIPAEQPRNVKMAKKFVEDITEDITAKLKVTLNAEAMALLVKIQKRICEDVTKLEDVGREIFSGVAAVQLRLMNCVWCVDPLPNQIDGLVQTCGIFSVGAAVYGWKQNRFRTAVMRELLFLRCRRV